jgi:hypothetical protein
MAELGIGGRGAVDLSRNSVEVRIAVVVLLLATGISLCAAWDMTPLPERRRAQIEDLDSQADAQDELRNEPSDQDGLDGPPGSSFTGREGAAWEDTD